MGKEREMGEEEEHAPRSMQDLLLSYAWCVELTLEHLHRLHFVGRSKRTVEYALERLVDAGWIERHGRRGTSRVLHSERAIGRRLPMVWSLTPEGHAQLKRLEAYPFKDSKDQYPAKASSVRNERLREHDLLLSDLVVELIERGRERGLSGVFVGRELRLEVERARPLMDALLLLHFHDVPCAPNVVPWTKDKATSKEQTLRYAVELDTGSEAIATVVKKAEEYAAIIRPDNRAWFEWWYPRYGARPFVLLILPENKSRFETVFEGWARAWPQGAWAMTTPSRLREDRWLTYNPQTKRRVEWSVFPSPKPTGEAQQLVTPSTRPTPAPAPAQPSQADVQTVSPSPVRDLEREEPPATAELPTPATAKLPTPAPAKPPTPAAVPAAQPRGVEPLSLSAALPAGTGGRPLVTGVVLHTPASLAELMRSRRVTAPTKEDYGRADRANWRRRYGLAGLWAILLWRWLRQRVWMLASWVWRGVCSVTAWILPRLWAGLCALARWMWRWVRQSPQRAAAVLLVLVLVGLSVWVARAQPWRAWTWPTTVTSASMEVAPTPAPLVQVIPTATPPVPACGRVQVTAERVNLRVAPGLGKQAEVLRKLKAGEVLWRLCDAPQSADGHTWQRVWGEIDVLSGWVAVEYLRVVE
jgi:hypothetical protein